MKSPPSPGSRTGTESIALVQGLDAEIGLIRKRMEEVNDKIAYQVTVIDEKEKALKESVETLKEYKRTMKDLVSKLKEVLRESQKLRLERLEELRKMI